MNKLRAFIVDDEKNSRIVLTDVLTRFYPETEVIGEASNVNDAYEGISELAPDIVFLDIQMPTGNGFTLLQKFDKIPFQVIFVTSHHQYAIQAFRFNALDYLLKPVDVDELGESIKRAKEHKMNSEEYQMRISNAMDNLNPQNELKKIPLHRNDSVHLVPVPSIVSIEGDGRYSTITTIEREKFTSTKTLKEYEEFLNEHAEFVRIHKETIINVNFIDKYSKREPYWVILNNGKEYEISRRKKQEVLEMLKRKNDA